MDSVIKKRIVFCGMWVFIGTILFYWPVQTTLVPDERSSDEILNRVKREPVYQDLIEQYKSECAGKPDIDYCENMVLQMNLLQEEALKENGKQLQENTSIVLKDTVISKRGLDVETDELETPVDDEKSAVEFENTTHKIINHSNEGIIETISGKFNVLNATDSGLDILHQSTNNRNESSEIDKGMPNQEPKDVTTNTPNDNVLTPASSDLSDRMERIVGSTDDRPKQSGFDSNTIHGPVTAESMKASSQLIVNPNFVPSNAPVTPACNFGPQSVPIPYKQFVQNGGFPSLPVGMPMYMPTPFYGYNFHQPAPAPFFNPMLFGYNHQSMGSSFPQSFGMQQMTPNMQPILCNYMSSMPSGYPYYPVAQDFRTATPLAASEESTDHHDDMMASVHYRDAQSLASKTYGNTSSRASSHSDNSHCDVGMTSCGSEILCIPDEKLCDGIVDCLDAFDESSCSCKSRIDAGKICDGYFDCPLGEDEMGCFDCHAAEFSCDNWSDKKSTVTCFKLENRCDGIPHCPNRKDEVECSMLAENVRHHAMFAVSHTEGYLHKNYKGKWYPVCQNPYQWAAEACERESGPVKISPAIQILDTPAHFKGRYIQHIFGNHVEFVGSCFGGKAVYVKCQNIDCGTRVKTLTQHLLHDLDDVDRKRRGTDIESFFTEQRADNGFKLRGDISDHTSYRSELNELPPIDIPPTDHLDTEDIHDDNILQIESNQYDILQTFKIGDRYVLQDTSFEDVDFDNNAYYKRTDGGNIYISNDHATTDATINGNRNKRGEARVVGGKASKPAAWPWVVAIYRNGMFHCGGVLLNERWVLSAAHCVDKYWKHYYEMQLGMLRRFSFSPQEQSHRISHIIVNAAYDRNDMWNDLSLLRLATEARFNRWVRPVCLPSVRNAGIGWLMGPRPGTLCTAVGWGATKEHGPDPDHMREVDVPIAVCKHKTDREGQEVCAGLPRGGKDACQGDSGGPLLCHNPQNPAQWYVAGIVSHGEGCARPGEPGAYTKVSLFLDWIMDNINSETLPDVTPKEKCPGFNCKWGFKRCLPMKLHCDRSVDCLGGEDETSCSFLSNTRQSLDKINILEDDLSHLLTDPVDSSQTLIPVGDFKPDLDLVESARKVPAVFQNETDLKIGSTTMEAISHREVQRINDNLNNLPTSANVNAVFNQTSSNVLGVETTEMFNSKTSLQNENSIQEFDKAVTLELPFGNTSFPRMTLDVTITQTDLSPMTIVSTTIKIEPEFLTSHNTLLIQPMSTPTPNTSVLETEDDNLSKDRERSETTTESLELLTIDNRTEVVLADADDDWLVYPHADDSEMIKLDVTTPNNFQEVAMDLWSTNDTVTTSFTDNPIEDFNDRSSNDSQMNINETKNLLEDGTQTTSSPQNRDQMEHQIGEVLIDRRNNDILLKDIETTANEFPENVTEVAGNILEDYDALNTSFIEHRHTTITHSEDLEGPTITIEKASDVDQTDDQDDASEIPEFIFDKVKNSVGKSIQATDHPVLEEEMATNNKIKFKLPPMLLPKFDNHTVDVSSTESDGFTETDGFVKAKSIEDTVTDGFVKAKSIEDTVTTSAPIGTQFLDVTSSRIDSMMDDSQTSGTTTEQLNLFNDNNIENDLNNIAVDITTSLLLPISKIDKTFVDDDEESTTVVGDNHTKGSTTLQNEIKQTTTMNPPLTNSTNSLHHSSSDVSNNEGNLNFDHSDQHEQTTELGKKIEHENIINNTNFLIDDVAPSHIHKKEMGNMNVMNISDIINDVNVDNSLNDEKSLINPAQETSEVPYPTFMESDIPFAIDLISLLAQGNHKDITQPPNSTNSLPVSKRPKSLVSNTFVCQRMTQTIPFAHRCDRKTDCEDGTDEFNCSCRDYLENSGKYSNLVCNGYIDCRDGSDEADCNFCPEDYFQCHLSRRCIPNKNVCNHVDDCMFREDELDCFALTDGHRILFDKDLRPHLNVEGIITAKRKGQWQPFCDINLSSKEQEGVAFHMCRYLGFSDYSNFNFIQLQRDMKFIDISSFRQRSRLRQNTEINIPADSAPSFFDHEQQPGNEDPLNRHFPANPFEIPMDVPSELEWCNALYVQCVTHMSSNITAHNLPAANTLPNENDVQFIPDTSLAEEAQELYLWPWMVKVYLDGVFCCTGVLMDLSWALVESSCFSSPSITNKYITVVIGSKQTVPFVVGPYEQTVPVDFIGNIIFSNATLIHLQTPCYYSRYARPMGLPEFNVNTITDDEICVAVGLDSVGETESVFLKPVKQSCGIVQKCFTRYGPTKCRAQAKTSSSTIQWKGVVACRTENGWFPSAVYNEPLGICGFENTVSLPGVTHLRTDINVIMRRSVQLPLSPPICDGVRCYRGKCIPKSKLCDGTPDCEFGADESPESCKSKKNMCAGDLTNPTCECPTGFMRCKSGECLSKTKFFNGFPECKDSSDEPEAPTCATYIELVSPRKMCDGIQHCLDRSDEDPSYCKCFAKNTFRCNDSSCIANDFVCDGRADCSEGEDESACMAIRNLGPLPGIGEVVQNTRGLWHTKCFNRPITSKSELEAVCRQLNFFNGHADVVQKPLAAEYGQPTQAIVWPFSAVRINERVNMTLRNVDNPIASSRILTDDDNCYPLYIECV